MAITDNLTNGHIFQMQILLHTQSPVSGTSITDISVTELCHSEEIGGKYNTTLVR